jgi:UDP-glucose 4-epimerase
MRILITGGAGFLGSHLVDACLKDHDVTVVDNFSTGRRENLSQASTRKNLTLVEGDVCDSKLMEQLIKNADLVYHFAAAVGVKNVIENPVEALTINSEGTRIIFTACAHHQKRVIFSSTSEVYGKTSKASLSESDDIILGPSNIGRWGYACSKAFDEFLAYAFGKEKGLKFVILRFFNVVGPRQSPHYGMVLPRLVRQAVQNEPLTIFGSGKQSRCFMHVADAVDAILQLSKLPQVANETINVGNPKSTSISELADYILKITNSASKIQLTDPLTVYDRVFADMEERTPDITKLKKLLNFEFKFTLEDAIRDVKLEYIK